MSHLVRVIGVVRTGLPSAVEAGPKLTGSGEWRGLVEVFPEYADGLAGIEGFSHIFVISYLHKLRRDSKGVLRVKPRRGLKGGPTVGVFATDSPARPNPLGLTLVRLVERKRNVLVVKGLDLYEGTPVVDIKPYRTDYKAWSHKVPTWVPKHDRERKPL